MTRTSGLLVAATALALVLTAPAATMALGTAPSAMQEEVQTADEPNVTVTNLTAPASVEAGETVNVSATVTMAESDTNATEATDTTDTNETDATNASNTNETDATNASDTNETDATNATDTTNTSDANGTDATDATETEVNATDANGTEVEVEYRLAGDVVATENVTLQPGESTTVNFSLDTTDLPARGYVHSVLAGDSGQDSSILVFGGDAEDVSEFSTNSTSFRVSNLSAPEETTAGEPVEVSAVVSNPESANATNDSETSDVTATTNATDVNDTDTTNATDINDTDTTNATDVNDTDTTTAVQENGTTQVVEFRVGGEVVDSQEVTLAPGENTTVNFTLETTDLEPGVYTHGVLTEDFGEMATVSVVNSTMDGTSASTTDEASTNETSVNATETPAPNGTDTSTNSTETTATNGTETTAPDGNESA